MALWREANISAAWHQKTEIKRNSNESVKGIWRQHKRNSDKRRRLAASVKRNVAAALQQ